MRVLKYSTLQRKTPLKAKTGLKAKTSLKSRTRLQQVKPLKAKQKTARKLKKPYRSIFTSNMDVCVITGCSGAEPHHIFGGANKVLSEKYGFMLPLRHDWHRSTNYAIHSDRKLNLKYKLLCEDFYINELGKSKEEWIEEFGKWW